MLDGVALYQSEKFWALNFLSVGAKFRNEIFDTKIFKRASYGKLTFVYNILKTEILLIENFSGDPKWLHFGIGDERYDF